MFPGSRDQTATFGIGNCSQPVAVRTQVPSSIQMASGARRERRGRKPPRRSAIPARLRPSAPTMPLKYGNRMEFGVGYPRRTARSSTPGALSRPKVRRHHGPRGRVFPKNLGAPRNRAAPLNYFGLVTVAVTTVAVAPALLRRLLLALFHD